MEELDQALLKLLSARCAINIALTLEYNPDMIEARNSINDAYNEIQKARVKLEGARSKLAEQKLTKEERELWGIKE